MISVGECVVEIASGYISCEEKIYITKCITTLKMAEMQTKMVQAQSELAICISNAVKSFSPDGISVLDGLSMSIRSGSM